MLPQLTSCLLNSKQSCGGGTDGMRVCHPLARCTPCRPTLRCAAPAAAPCSPQVMRGYHNNVKANQKVFPLGQHTGWLDTGGPHAAGCPVLLMVCCSHLPQVQQGCGCLQLIGDEGLMAAAQLTPNVTASARCTARQVRLRLLQATWAGWFRTGWATPGWAATS